MDDNSVDNYLTADEFKKALKKFDQKTTAQQYTIVAFHGFAQREAFRNVLKEHCSVPVIERCHWRKENYNPGGDPETQMLNTVEEFLVAYHDKNGGTAKQGWQRNYAADKEHQAKVRMTSH